MIINIATGNLTSICDLATKIKNITGSSSEIITLPCEPGESDEKLSIDTELARKALGWAPEYSLEEGLARTICWYKNLLSI